MQSRPPDRRSRALTRRALLIGFVVTLAASGGLAAFAASAPRRLRYRVTHALYGEIGSYINEIDQQGDSSIVHTQVHLLVRVLGIVLHREDADRLERWSDNRLIAFHGVTTVNGEVTEISGEARGDRFAVTSPGGTNLVPATVRPSNPWSAGFLDLDALMQTDTGTVEQVRVGKPESTAVTIDDVIMPARKYEIAATPSYTIWLNEQDVPVMFSVHDESGLVTFTLTERP
jgi:hypothetical protein